MARLSQITQGTRARRPLRLSFGEAEAVVDVRPLTAAEEIEALAEARAYAIAKGLPEPKEGEPVYDLAVMAHIAAKACLDHDQPVASVPFFDSAEQALSLDRDRLQMLYEGWSTWQDELSPRKGKLSADEYALLIFQLAEGGEGGAGDADPFLLNLPRATLASCLRTLARQLASSPTPSSPSSSSASPAGEPGSPGSEG